MPCWQKWIITGDLSVLPRERQPAFKRRVLLKMALVRSGREQPRHEVSLAASSAPAAAKPSCGSPAGLWGCAQGREHRSEMGVWGLFYFCHFPYPGCQTSKRSSRDQRARLQQGLASGPAAPQNPVLGPQEGRASQPRAWAASLRAGPGPCPHPGAAGTRPQHGPAAPGLRTLLVLQ